MKRAVVLVMVGACGGGDDGGMPDALIQQGPEYDLSCLNNMVTTVPTTISLAGTIYNATLLPGFAPVAGTVTAFRISDNVQIGASTNDPDGKFLLELTTTGTPARVRYEIDAPPLLPSRWFVNIPPWMSTDQGVFFGAGTARTDAIATSLGATVDASKGVVEVWANDCSKGELPGATVTIDDAPDAQWSMFAGQGSWIPRATTLGHPQGANVGSIAATLNVAPGTHGVTVTAGALSLKSTIEVTAGSWTVLVVVPGTPL